MTLKPIAFLNGDGGTGRGATIVRESIFKDFPTVDVPMDVQSRIATNDGCIAEAVNALKQCGAGFKNSTGSNDPEMKKRRWKSANIAMRPLANAFAMARILQGPGRYSNLCGVLRLATGGFYEEAACEEKDGKLFIQQTLDLNKLSHFATLATVLAEKNDFHLVLASKSTIAKSELTVRNTVEQIWWDKGFAEIDLKDPWTSTTWHHELTDIALASLPIETGEGRSMYANGNFLMVCDNPNGDTASDIVDIQHGNRVMGSTVYCIDEDGKWFTYEELPGGTADGKATGELKGANFLAPGGIIFAFCSAFEQVNPDQKLFFDSVRAETLDYLTNTPKEDRDTEVMIQQIAEKSLPYLVTE